MIPVDFIYFYCIYPLYLLVILSIYHIFRAIVSFPVGRNEYLATGGFHFFSMRHVH